MSKFDTFSRPRSRLGFLAVGALVAAAAFTAWQLPAGAAEDAVVIPPPAMDEKPAAATEKAIFAGGCFWGVQGVFQHVKGVTKAVSGYTGGDKDTAVYEMVGSRPDRPRRNGRDHLRPVQGDLWPAAAGLFLGRPQPDPAELPGAGQRHPVPFDDLRRDDAAEEDRAELYRPARQGEGVCRADRHHAGDRSRPSIRPRTITRIS